MVRTHPQWLAVRDLIAQDRIGAVQAITMFFSYFNDDAANIRNKPEMGGGALMDIGCYCINLSRFILGSEPRRVAALIKRDDNSGIDKLTSAIMDFPGVSLDLYLFDAARPVSADTFCRHRRTHRSRNSGEHSARPADADFR